MVLLSRLYRSCQNARTSATLAPVCSCRFATALYMDDMRASMSTKKVPGAGSPIAKRCAFVGHLRNAENIAAEIRLLAPIAIDHARVSANMICKECRDRMR